MEDWQRQCSVIISHVHSDQTLLFHARHRVVPPTSTILRATTRSQSHIWQM